MTKHYTYSFVYLKVKDFIVFGIHERKTISIYPKKRIQFPIPFASIVWTVNFQFSYRSICSFVVEDLIVEESLFEVFVLAVLISKTHGSNVILLIKTKLVLLLKLGWLQVHSGSAKVSIGRVPSWQNILSRDNYK